ncbi:MAG: toll/interleukin-1 receptor domain-containing protein [Hyphomonadaceae bacterium]|nr:toll/interleukin-1 receptor domain-containing protein [Hyphomonadaceae bacterium]
MADVFLTFAPSDAELALRISKALERSGLSVSRGPLQYASNWPTRLYDEVDACTAVVALWSRDSLRCDWVMTEAAIGGHFGQTVSIRSDPALERDMIPAVFREGPGIEVTDIFEGDIAPKGWGASAAEMLDRKLAPVAGRIRALKARGPVAAPASAAGAVLPSEEAQRRLSAEFAYVRADQGARGGKSLPALAATRREAAFRSAYAALAAMEYPSDIRAALVDFTEADAARKGLARIYAEALSRNDREFWGHVGRLALPFSAALAVAGLQRSGEGAPVIADLIDPRDLREMHAERFGRVRMRSSGGSVVLWPIAAVAVGLGLLVAGPQLQRVMPSSPSFDVASNDVAPKTAPLPPPPAPRVIPPPPVTTPTPSIIAAPAPMVAPAALPAPPPPAPTIIAPAPTQSTVVAGPLQDMLPTQVTRLRYCRMAPTEKEMTVEVLEGERLFDVAGRVFMDSSEGIAEIVRRNAACLDSRQLMLADGRVLSGSNLLFAGDRLVVPAKPPATAAGVVTTPPPANQPI